ncbi:tRNAHis guanylyltransferase [Artemisia annua]|uniref:tRNA(His) guanylyltransferase n=1 Tax=Artemisia annua TaxID=35608 RepID=A0A2U1Q8Z7_ARTAN|nr:tRNAHis guanylyltransferase [Artemisia annua]
MALNNKFAHVKKKEIQDELKYGCFIVVQIRFSNYARFCQLNGFEKPSDIKAQNLMNVCAVEVCKECPDIILAYGFGHEYSFIFKKDFDYYSRRARMKWTEFFPHNDMRSSALFEGEVLCLKESKDIQAYLAYKQEECETHTCFWKLVESGKSEQEAHEILEESKKGKGKQAKTEILFQQFGINYKILPDIFRQGSCILRTEIEDKRKVITVQAKNIASKHFLNGYSYLSEELNGLKQNASSIGIKDLNKWRDEHKIKQNRWIVIRVDGCSFSRFTEVHEFEKPTDEQALTLMNSCAMAVFKEFKGIVYGYGASDEYSFVLEKNTELYQREGRFCQLNGFEKPSDIKAQNLMNACAVEVCKECPDIILAYGFGHEYSFIFKKDFDYYSRRARMKWTEFFPHNDMRSSALFEGEVLCLKESKDIQAYLAYKQEECETHTCFWKLVESGKSEQEAHEILEESKKGKGKQAKTEILFQQFGINYKILPDIFRQGSCILRTEIEDKRKVITVQAKNIASKHFLNGYSYLSEELNGLKQNASSIGIKDLNKWRDEHKIKQNRWIVIRVDGCSFSRFTEVHEFEKPTDEQALTLMNSCAMAVFKEFKGIVYGYGASDEYSFVLEKNTELYQREGRLNKTLKELPFDSCSKLASAICSSFTDAYVSKWKEFFPKKELQYPPRFDGRAVGYKSYKLIRDYLSWRQVDCKLCVSRAVKNIIFTRRLNKTLKELPFDSCSKLASAICSSFTDAYVSKWKEFFPIKELQYAPRFDGRAVGYKSYKLIRDYLSWRQVDCHVNNRHNTCFWALVKSGKSRREAQTRLQVNYVSVGQSRISFSLGTSTKEKYQMLSQEFGIDYNQLPLKFLNGSSVFWDDKEVNGEKKLVVEYPNIIKDDFWHEHPLIIKNTDSKYTTFEYCSMFVSPLFFSLVARLFW